MSSASSKIPTGKTKLTRPRNDSSTARGSKSRESTSATGSKIPTGKTKLTRPRNDSSAARGLKSRESTSATGSKSRPLRAQPSNEPGPSNVWSRVDTSKIAKRPTNVAGLHNVKDEKITVQGETNLLKIGALVEKVSRQKNVIEVEGTLEKKLMLAYKNPAKPPKPPKPEKKKKPRIKMKSKGMGTDPPPLTVNSGTWTAPVTTNTRKTLTNTAPVQSQAIQSDSPKAVPIGTMTPRQIVAAVGVSAVPNCENKGNTTGRSPVLMDRGVGEILPATNPTENGGIKAKQKTKLLLVSTAMNHKPTVEHKSAHTQVRHFKSQASATNKLETGTKAVSAVSDRRDNTCCPMPPPVGAKGVQAVQVQRARYCSTSDLYRLKDTGVLTTRLEQDAVSTMTERHSQRHMAVGTKNKDKKNIDRLEGQFYEMQMQHKQIVNMTKQIFEDEEKKRQQALMRKPPTGRKPRKRMTEPPSSCSCSCSSCLTNPDDKYRPNVICSCLLCKNCVHKITYPQDNQRPRPIEKPRHPSRSMRARSEFINSNSPSLLCIDSCRCERCFAVPPDEARTSKPTRRRRIHSNISLPMPRDQSCIPDIFIQNLAPPALVTVSVNKNSPEQPQRSRRRVHSMILLGAEKTSGDVDYPVNRGRPVRVRTPSNCSTFGYRTF